MAMLSFGMNGFKADLFCGPIPFKSENRGAVLHDFGPHFAQYHTFAKPFGISSSEFLSNATFLEFRDVTADGPNYTISLAFRSDTSQPDRATELQPFFSAVTMQTILRLAKRRLDTRRNYFCQRRELSHDTPFQQITTRSCQA
jgi:hypothetical protein